MNFRKIKRKINGIICFFLDHEYVLMDTCVHCGQKRGETKAFKSDAIEFINLIIGLILRFILIIILGMFKVLEIIVNTGEAVGRFSKRKFLSKIPSGRGGDS